MERDDEPSSSSNMYSLPIPHPRSHVLTRSAPRHRCSSRLRRRVLVSGNGRPYEFGRVAQKDFAVEAESCAAKVKEECERKEWHKKEAKVSHEKKDKKEDRRRGCEFGRRRTRGREVVSTDVHCSRTSLSLYARCGSIALMSRVLSGRRLRWQS